MKRLLIFAALAVLGAAAVGCNSTRQAMSGCGCFGNRGAQCNACMTPAAQPCCPQPNCCDPCGGNSGYYAGNGYYGGAGYSEMAPALQGGSCCGGSGGFMPQEGMIYGGGGVQVVPGPMTGPMVVPSQPMPGPETSLQP